MGRNAIFFLIAASLSVLHACGQTGDLYWPDNVPDVVIEDTTDDDTT